MTSAKFDPLYALYNPHLVQLPFEGKVLPLNNVAQCKKLLVESNCVPATKRIGSCEETKEQQKKKEKKDWFKERALKIQQQLETIREGGGPLERFYKSIEDPVFAPLHRIAHSKRKICIQLRGNNSGKGHQAIGLLIGYDKYMNVVLSDVYEKFDKVYYFGAPADCHAFCRKLVATLESMQQPCAILSYSTTDITSEAMEAERRLAPEYRPKSDAKLKLGEVGVQRLVVTLERRSTLLAVGASQVITFSEYR